MEKETKISQGTRLASMLIDHFLMTLIGVVFFIPVMIKAFSGAFTISHEQPDPFDLTSPLYYVGLFGFALYFCKDCINGRSLAKRITKLQVVDNITGEAASPLQCFIRNLFCAIWPVEVIVALSNPARRIGDLVAGTKVQHYYPENEAPKTNIKKLVLVLALSYGLLVLIMIPFRNAGPAAHKTNFIESSYNEAESKALEKLYAGDSLGHLLTASVKLYDSAANNKKIISVIFLFKENYFNYPGKISEIEQRTLNVLYTVYPYNTISGHGQYIYKEDHFMQDYTNEIGTTNVAFPAR